MNFHVGFVGGGNITATHARAAQGIPGIQIAAFCGANLQKVNALSLEFGGTPYQDYMKFLTHRPMDVVLIGSPSGLHASQGIEAAKRGMHLLVEKPLDITTERVDALIAATEEAGVQLGVIFQDRLNPGICRLKSLFDAGTLGLPLLADARVKWYRSSAYYAESRWRGTWSLDGGGALMNQGIHTVDLLLWLLGNVRRVHARTVTALHAIEVEDTAAAILEFESGALGILQVPTAAYPGYPRRLELTGSKGTVVLSQDQIVAADLQGAAVDIATAEETDQNKSALSPLISDVRGHQRILEDFIQAIQKGGHPCCNGHDGRRSVAVVEAIYQSSQSSQSVALKN